MLSNIYSKSNLQSSPAMAVKTQILLYDRFLPTMAGFAKSSRPFDIYAHISAATMDFVTSYQFGLASSADLMRDKKQWKKFLAVYQIRQSFNFWPQELPRLTSFLKKLGIRMVPRWVDEANHDIESWVLKMCSGAAEALQKQSKTTLGPSIDGVYDVPEVYSQLKAAMNKNKFKSNTASTAETGSHQQLEIASELLDHLAAGFDTSGITLTYFVHEISQRPEIQATLRKELRSLDPPLIFERGKTAENVIPTAKALDSLPFLQATLQETLRLRAAIPGPEPRITPASGCVLGPNGEYYVPGRVRVSAQAHSLHRNSEVFEKPRDWIPSRWLKPADDEQLKEMYRWFWAFGSGGRMCVGSNLAIYRMLITAHLRVIGNRATDLKFAVVMKYIIAAIYTNFTTTLVDDEGIEQRDLYTAPPTGGKLIVKLEAVPRD
jgi:hypothetical protein